MDPPHIDRHVVLQQFDRLHEAGDLLYTPSTTVVSLEDNGFKFEFRVTPAQKTKPSFPDQDGSSTPPSKSGENQEKNQTNGHTPSSEHQQNGTATSDIDNFLPEWHIAHVNGTHRLILNKYNIYRPQYVLLTADPARRQTSPLDKSDFVAAWTLLQDLQAPHYVIFNCGKQAGGSRMHKHLQVFEQDRAELLPDRLLLLGGTKTAGAEAVPYKYALASVPSQQLSGPDDAAAVLLDIYQRHVQFCAAALHLPADALSDAEGIVPHNVVLTSRWILTIPRRQAGLGAATANAAGFLGLVWVPEASVIDLWKDLGPAHVLASLGMAAER